MINAPNSPAPLAEVIATRNATFMEEKIDMEQEANDSKGLVSTERTMFKFHWAVRYYRQKSTD